ncbi:MAG: DUF4404 family protein [Chloroflexi bacterium]|nr:DUF4404 family protein [Chloroflexota bacterium]
MSDQKLRELLRQLHDELERTKSLDPKGLELLSQINADIRKLLDPDQENPKTLMDRLQSAIDHFEVEHPAVTAALSQILNALSNAGI